MEVLRECGLSVFPSFVFIYLMEEKKKKNDNDTHALIIAINKMISCDLNEMTEIVFPGTPN